MHPRDGAHLEETSPLLAVSSAAQDSPTATDAAVNGRAQRLVSLDLLRGLVMIFESIDHARNFLANFDKGHIKHERW